jgi:hypothetical protein
MARVERIATAQLANLLRGDDGAGPISEQLIQQEQLQVSPLEVTAVLEQFVAADVAEKASAARYPAIHVYCDKVSNTLQEKFRAFSGTAQLNIDVRVSHEHLDRLHEQLQIYVESVTEVLQRKRGTWGMGVMYTGGYELIFSPVKRGGRNYIQSALIKLEVHISV